MCTHVSECFVCVMVPSRGCLYFFTVCGHGLNGAPTLGTGFVHCLMEDCTFLTLGHVPTRKYLGEGLDKD